jgi:PleD family two-component response regulator
MYVSNILLLVIFSQAPSSHKHVAAITKLLAEDDAVKAQPVNASQLRVLVVDDSVPIVKMLTRWLEKQGCIVSSAPNGKIGLAMLQEHQYDILLLDFLMVIILINLNCFVAFPLHVLCVLIAF